MNDLDTSSIGMLFVLRSERNPIGRSETQDHKLNVVCAQILGWKNFDPCPGIIFCVDWGSFDIGNETFP